MLYREGSRVHMDPGLVGWLVVYRERNCSSLPPPPQGYNGALPAFIEYEGGPTPGLERGTGHVRGLYLTCGEPAPPPSLWDVGEDRARKQYRAPAERQPGGLPLSGAGRPHPSQTNEGGKKAA